MPMLTLLRMAPPPVMHADDIASRQRSIYMRRPQSSPP
jgi:hypothetical protein